MVDASPALRLAASVLVLTLAGMLTSCGDPFFSDGDDLARDAAENVAAQIGSHSDNTTEVTLEEMVAYWVPEGSVSASPGIATVEPLAWSGAIGHDSSATIDVRIRARVDAVSSPTVFGRSNTAGEATVCYRLVWPRYEQAERTEIDCPSTPAPPRPEPAPRPELTEQDTATVIDLVGATVGVVELQEALSAAFPEEYMSVETELWNGETVVAVGIPAERECILVVRRADGEIFEPSYRRISLEPGEVGCGTGLYTNPPF